MRPLDHALSYYNFRDNLAGDIRSGRCEPNIDAIARRVRDCSGLQPHEAAELTERFLNSITRELSRRRGIS
jgi:hypothetical protein